MTPSDAQEQGPGSERKSMPGQPSESQQTQPQPIVPENAHQGSPQEQSSDTKPTTPPARIPIFKGMPLDEDQMKREEQAYSQSVSGIEESAKQLLGITSVLQTLYVAIFAFSDLRKQVQDLDLPFLLRVILLILYFLPLLLWLASLYFATQIFIVRRINVYTFNLTMMRQAREVSIRFGSRMLVLFQRSLIGLLVSSGLVLILLGTIVFLLPPPASTTPPTQIIIVTPTPVSKLTPAP